MLRVARHFFGKGIFWALSDPLVTPQNVFSPDNSTLSIGTNHTVSVMIVNAITVLVLISLSRGRLK